MNNVKLFLIVIVLILSQIIYAQKKYPKILIGISGGINESVFKLPDNGLYEEFGKKYKGEVGYNYTITFKSELSSKFSFETGLTYYNKVSQTDGFELVFEKDLIVIKDNIYNFNGKLFRHSKVNFTSLQVPIRFNFNVFKKKNIDIYVFGGFFKDFNLRLKNTKELKHELTPVNENKSINDLAEKYFILDYSSYSNQITNIDLSTIFITNKPDKSGIGYFYGFGSNYKKLGLEINFNISEDTFKNSAIFRFNSTSLNLRYFL